MYYVACWDFPVTVTCKCLKSFLSFEFLTVPNSSTSSSVSYSSSLSGLIVNILYLSSALLSYFNQIVPLASEITTFAAPSKMLTEIIVSLSLDTLTKYLLYRPYITLSLRTLFSFNSISLEEERKLMLNSKSPSKQQIHKKNTHFSHYSSRYSYDFSTKTSKG